MIVLGPSFYGDIWADLQSTLNFTYTMVNLLSLVYKTNYAKIKALKHIIFLGNFLFRLDQGMICLELTLEMELLMEL